MPQTSSDIRAYQVLVTCIRDFGGCAGLVSHDFIPIFLVAEGLLPASSASAWTFPSFLNWSRLKRRVFV